MTYAERRGNPLSNVTSGGGKKKKKKMAAYPTWMERSKSAYYLYLFIYLFYFLRCHATPKQKANVLAGNTVRVTRKKVEGKKEKREMGKPGRENVIKKKKEKKRQRKRRSRERGVRDVMSANWWKVWGFISSRQPLEKMTKLDRVLWWWRGSDVKKRKRENENRCNALQVRCMKTLVVFCLCGFVLR